MNLALYRESLTYNNTIYTYVIYGVLLVVFIEYSLFDRKLKKINERIEDLTNKNELLVKENTDFQLQLQGDVKKLQEENENKNDEIDYILRLLDNYIEKYRSLEAYIDDTIHENTQCLEEKIEESIEELSQNLEKTHDDLSRACFSRHTCVIDEIESIKTELLDNREKARMLSHNIEVINENNIEKTDIISSINDKLIAVSQEVVLTNVSNNENIQELKTEQEKMSKIIYASKEFIGGRYGYGYIEDIIKKTKLLDNRMELTTNEKKQELKTEQEKMSKIIYALREYITLMRHMAEIGAFSHLNFENNTKGLSWADFNVKKSELNMELYNEQTKIYNDEIKLYELKYTFI
jgi:hypothetical protein